MGARLRVRTDSSAAMGICTRQGLGKLRHLDTHTLWIQQAVRTGRVDLRKVLGEENPADLLTKHSLSRQRLEKLVALHGCKYLAGRAASAPKMREGETTRTTMASEGGGLIGAAGNGIGAAHRNARVVVVDSPVDGGTLHGNGAPGEEAEEYLGSGSPTMPHLQLHGQNLDDAYPPIAVPEDEELPDLVQDKHDTVLQRGLEEAAVISREARDQGRKRKMSPTAMPSGNGQAKETVKDGVNFVNLVEETTGRKAISRSTLGRRRSKRKRPPPREDSDDGFHRRHSEGSRRENPDGAGSREYADHVDARCNDQEIHMSEPASVSSFVSVFDLCACDLHRLAQALLPRCVHLADTRIF